MPDLKKVAEDIANAYDARVKIVRGIAEDTQSMLKGFHERREAMAKELQDVLAKSEHLRKKDFTIMMQGILLTQAGRENTVKQILADFRQEEEMVSGQLKKLLGRGEELRIKDFKRVLARIQANQEERQKEVREKASSELANMQSEVATMLANFKNEREKMSSEWKNMVAALSKVKKYKG